MITLPIFVERALCAESDSPDDWYPEKHGDNGNGAKKVCHRCPARRECLAWAIKHDERDGIWGGLSADQRFRMRPGPRMNAPMTRIANAAARRAEVVRLTEQGYSVQSIAAQLAMGESTVKDHRTNARRLGEL